MKAFEKLAKTNNTLILPTNASDISNFVAQAMAVYKTINSKEEIKIENVKQEMNPVSPPENESLCENSNVVKDNLNEFELTNEKK